MNTITAILEAAEDGALHLPVPAEWRRRPIRVRADLEPSGSSGTEAYTAEWRAAFGSVADESFEPPSRGEARPIESLEA